MLIGYPPPALTGITITGAAWLTADGGAACCDGKPARKARANGTPTITLAYAQPFVPRIIAVLGLAGVEPGTAITATAADGTALGGNAATAQAVRLADGTVAAWIVTGGAVTVATGVTIAVATTGVIDIGELVAMPAVETLLERDWKFLEPGSSQRLSRGRASQVSGVAGVDFRRLFAPVAAAPVAEVRGGGLAGGMDWQRLRTAIAGGARVIAIPRWKTVDGTVDVDEVNATALYGIVASQGDIAHLGGDQYSWSLSFEEVPAI